MGCCVFGGGFFQSASQASLDLALDVERCRNPSPSLPVWSLTTTCRRSPPLTDMSHRLFPRKNSSGMVPSICGNIDRRTPIRAEDTNCPFDGLNRRLDRRRFFLFNSDRMVGERAACRLRFAASDLTCARQSLDGGRRYGRFSIRRLVFFSLLWHNLRRPFQKGLGDARPPGRMPAPR